MKISFRNIVQVDKFCKAAEKYDGNVTVSEGSISVDGESIVGIMTLGLNKILEVNKEFIDENIYQTVFEKINS